MEKEWYRYIILHLIQNITKHKLGPKWMLGNWSPDAQAPGQQPATPIAEHLQNSALWWRKEQLEKTLELIFDGNDDEGKRWGIQILCNIFPLQH